MVIDEPYFMTNDAWYYYDKDKEQYILTEEATEAAKASYITFYKEIKANY